MKKRAKTTLFLSFSFLLCACGGSGGEAASSSVSSESNSSSSIETAVPDYVYLQIRRASESFRMKARESENVTRGDGVLLVSNTYDYDILNDSSSNGGIHEVSVSKGEVTTLDYAKGSRGYAAIEGLNYKNEVFQTEALVDSSRVNYDQEYANPFLFLKKEDLCRVDESHYELSSLKNQLFAKYLLGCAYSISSIVFSYTGEALTGLSISSLPYSINYEDKNTSTYIPCTLTYEVDARLSGLGSSAYVHVSPVESVDKEKEDVLKTAFSNMGDNFTMVVNSHYQDEEPNEEYDTYWYFTGEEAYHQAHLNDQSKAYDLYYHKDASKDDDRLYLYDYDETSGQWAYNKPIYSQSYNVDPQDYSYFLPKFADMAPELFAYDETKSAYVCNVDAARKFLGNDFLGGGYKTSYFTNGEGNQAEVYLNKSGTRVEKVIVGYYAVDSQGYDVSRSYTLNFLNVGSTVLPSFVKE